MLPATTYWHMLQKYIYNNINTFETRVYSVLLSSKVLSPFQGYLIFANNGTVP